MNQIQKYVLTGGSCLVIGLIMGTTVTGGEDKSQSDLASSVSVDSKVSNAAGDLDELEKAYEDAMSAVGSSTPRGYRPDPAVSNGMKHAAEINEMLCKTRGINCEEAKLFRRQYEEMSSGL